MSAPEPTIADVLERLDGLERQLARKAGVISERAERERFRRRHNARHAARRRAFVEDRAHPSLSSALSAPSAVNFTAEIAESAEMPGGTAGREGQGSGQDAEPQE
jgi:hypothetical protein